jgi:hypothetical protein
MSDVTSKRRMIQNEAVRASAAVSESIAYILGQAINFINTNQHLMKTWNINGNYGVVSMPQSRVDGILPFYRDAEILDVWLVIQNCGSAGDTEVDLLRATAPGGAWTSIFTTKPKINFVAGNDAWVKLGSVGTGLTAPVLALTSLNAGDVLRCDLIQAQTGITVNGANVVIFHRPR